ncbi:MAG: acyl-CoA dehydrogenase family protein [Alphaproteobacteria bacterium]|nr:acyl-CoA dehydrogenase family protein [Alphaproteobacteria bacterium]
MDLSLSSKAYAVLDQVRQFFEQDILPRNREMIRSVKQDGDLDPPFLDQLRAKAKSQGLWNLAQTELADHQPGLPMSNLDYSLIAEFLGRVLWSSKAFNCQWPDVPNMVALQRYANEQQKEKWLQPLLDGECQSAFAMTEPATASSDAKNIAATITRDGDDYIVDGLKWYITGGGHERCRFYLFLGVSNPDAGPNRQHSVILVPRDATGVTAGAANSFFGYSEPNGPASEINFDQVRVPKENLLGEEGEGFAVSQARLAPARLHHSMRAVGQCELLIELMYARALERQAFGRPLVGYDTVQYAIAHSRVETEQMRLLLRKVAAQVDIEGEKSAYRDLSILKVAIAQGYFRIADRAVQVFGAMGGYDGTPVADAFAWSRAFRIGDGPDEVHLRSIFRAEPVPEMVLSTSPYILPPDISR